MQLDTPLIVTVTIDGDPVTKGRPRFSRGGRAFTPERTRVAEQHVALLAQEAMGGRDAHDGPVSVTVRFFTKTRRRSDLDNLVKLVLDACNRIVWTDDHQVVHIDASVTRADPEPRTELEVLAV